MLYIGCLVLLFSISRCSSSPINNCSKSEGPCWCHNDIFFLKLHCKDVNPGIRLQNNPSEIEVEDGEVEELQSEMFEGLCVKRLTLQLPRLRSINESTFYYLRDCLNMLLLLDGKLTEVPIDALNKLAHLELLSLSGNQVTSVHSMQQLPLRHLMLSSNKISSLVKDAFPAQLKSLSLSNNQIRILNGSLSSLKDVFWLFISNNKINSLSGELIGLKSLELLIATNNNIEDLNDSFKNLKKLRNLDLSHNRIRKLKNNLHSLFNLKILNLSYNFIRRLVGKEFINLLNLESLNLSYNQLENVANAFLHVRKLKRLNLAGNKLQVLGNSIRCLNQLVILDLSKNHLTELNWMIEDEENNLHQCPNTDQNSLKWLIVTDNPLQCDTFQKVNETIINHKIRVFGPPTC